MIDRNRIPGQLCEEFSVLGSTGNVGLVSARWKDGQLTPVKIQVYTVTINHKPRCNCTTHTSSFLCSLTDELYQAPMLAEATTANIL